MRIRAELFILDHNSGTERTDAETKDRQQRYTLAFPKQSAKSTPRINETKKVLFK